MRILLGVLSVVLAVAFLAFGGMKVFNTQVFVDQMGLPSALVVVIGLLELAGAAGLVVGFWARVLGAAAAAGLSLLMLGAVGFHVLHGDLLQNGLLPVVLLVVSVVAAVLKTRELRSNRSEAPVRA